MKTKIYLLLCILIVTSCSKKDISESADLMLNVSLGELVKTKTSLKSIIDDYNVITLETTDESLIGGSAIGMPSTKVMKSEGKFFVQSINDIVIFDNEGHFIGRLSKVGAGPGEYEIIMDFDVVPEYGEIWVSTYNRIARYDIESLDYKSSIPLDFYANKIKYLGDGTFIALTPDDKVFNICSEEGEVLDSYFDKDLALSGETAVQFINMGGIEASVLGFSNSAVCYDSNNKKFYISDILENKNHRFATIEDSHEYYDKYGFLEFPNKIMDNFASIISFRQLGDQVIMSIKYPNKDISFVVDDGNKTSEYIVRSVGDCVIEDDIFGKADASFLRTYASCMSDDSFLFLVESDDPDPNPSILEVKKFK